MKKRDYYLAVMGTDQRLLRHWIINAFSYVRKRPMLSEVTYPYQVISDPAYPDKLCFAKPTDGGYVVEVIEDSSVNMALFRAKEPLDIVEGELLLTTGNINTTYGIILQNMLIIYYAFVNKIGFVNAMLTTKFEDQIPELLTDNAPMEQRQPDRIYVDEYLRFIEGVEYITTFDHLFVSSGSENILVISDDVLDLKKKLLAQHKDELNDITVEAQITDQLVAADKASFKDDEDARDFLITGKSYNPTRKKQLGMIGSAGAFGPDTKTTFIAESLNDGWRKDQIHLHANEARAGSFFRGKETQEGGAGAKESNRIIMNTRVSMDYCGTNKGKPTFHADVNAKKYIGLYAVNGNKPVLITEGNLAQLKDKQFMVHSPQYCQAKKPNYCAVCVGKQYSLLRNGLGSAVTNVYDVYMYDKMKRMHGVALVTVRINIFKIAC